MMSKYVASWSRQAYKAESSWGLLQCSAAPSQAGACHGRPGQAGKGQHQPVRVHHFLLQLDTAPATLPPLAAFDKLFYLHCPQTRTFFINPNWNQGTFSQGFPMNHCCKALEAKLALQRLEPDSATEAAFIKANVHQICLLSMFAVLLFFILFFSILRIRKLSQCFSLMVALDNQRPEKLDRFT